MYKKKITILLNDSMYEKLIAITNHDQISISDFVRMAIIRRWNEKLL